MAAFYPWLVCLFYSFAGPRRRDEFLIFQQPRKLRWRAVSHGTAGAGTAGAPK